MTDPASQPHILIVSASTGSGHVRAAEALELCLHERYPHIKVTNVDMMEYVSWLFKLSYVKGYIDMMMYQRWLFGLLYKYMDKPPRNNVIQYLRLWFQKINMGRARKAFRQLNPGHVICTHFTPAEMFDRARRNGVRIPPVSVVVTDFNVHWIWVYRMLDEHFVANTEAAVRLAGRDIAPEKIHVAGIPLCPVFAQNYSVPANRTALGLQPDTTTILLLAGGFCISKIDLLARKLLLHELKLQLIAVAGNNKVLQASFERVALEFPDRLIVVGFTKEIENYMAASDLVITKPGGLTISECLALGKPMIMIDPIPGQEVRNAAYVMEKGAGVMAYDDVGILYHLDELALNPGRLAHMQESARLAGRPQAGFDIVDIIVKRYFPGCADNA
jgi:processive 1,2-diacylglycerol beta-glucosyltransferase